MLTMLTVPTQNSCHRGCGCSGLSPCAALNGTSPQAGWPTSPRALGRPLRRAQIRPALRRWRMARYGARGARRFNVERGSVMRYGMTYHGAGWPKSPRVLAGRLRRAQTSLRTLGIEIAFGREGRAGTRIIRISASHETRERRRVAERDDAARARPTVYNGRHVTKPERRREANQTHYPTNCRIHGPQGTRGEVFHQPAEIGMAAGSTGTRCATGHGLVPQPGPLDRVT
jgi:hypothetical protein